MTTKTTVQCGAGCVGGMFYPPPSASPEVAYEVVCTRGCHALAYMDSRGAWSVVPTGKTPGAREHARRRISEPVSAAAEKLLPQGRAFRHFG